MFKWILYADVHRVLTESESDEGIDMQDNDPIDLCMFDAREQKEIMQCVDQEIKGFVTHCNESGEKDNPLHRAIASGAYTVKRNGLRTIFRFKDVIEDVFYKMTDSEVDDGYFCEPSDEIATDQGNVCVIFGMHYD